jgi:hypothetical protein
MTRSERRNPSGRAHLRTWNFTTALCTSLLFASGALADPPPSHDQDAAPTRASATKPSTFPARVDGDGDAQLAVSFYPATSSNDSSPVAVCTAPCKVDVPEGKYRVVVETADLAERGTAHVTVRGPTYLVVVAPSKSERETGRALTVTGLVALVGGVALTFYGVSAALSGSCGEPECNSNSGAGAGAFAGGLTLAALGLVLTPVGGVIWSKSYSPKIVETDSAPEPPITARVGLVPIRGGVGLGGGFVF